MSKNKDSRNDRKNDRKNDDSQNDTNSSHSHWKSFDVDQEVATQLASGRPYREFLRVPALSTGIYTLEAGANDLQGPHDEDEVYYVIRGRGRLRVDGEHDVAVGPGSILYVQASAEHSFFEIEEQMTLLVFFATGGESD